MAGRPKEPIALVVAKGKKHLTKSEIAEREAQELHVPDDEIVAPSYLLKRQKADFDVLAAQLIELDILKNLDVDALAAYIVARDGWTNAVKRLRSAEVKRSLEAFEKWTRIEDRYRKQMRTAASDLGLTITSRGKIVVPTPSTPIPKENKFAKFSALESKVSGNA